MDYEKKYKEGVEWLRDWIYLATTGEMREQMEKHFPELKESEDEKTRKWIIENIQETLDVDGFFEGQKTMAKNAIAWLEKQGEQKPEWTTVDEQNLNVVLSHIPNECLRRWLKEAIHVRYNKPTEWGEEDEKMLNLIIAVFEVNHPNEYFKANELNDPNMRAVYTEEIVTWLESLKDKYTWTPSDEQIGVIEAVINNRSFQKRHLDSLYEQLKKLKGE